MENSSSTSDRSPDSISVDIREVLFGDEPLEKIGAITQDAAENSPWACFAAAALRQAEGDVPGAIAALRQVLQFRDQEVRLFLQAWHCLRGFDQQPPEALAVYAQGILVEVALERGLDIVAAYADGSARYINYSGAAIVWDTRDADIDRLVSELLSVGQSIVEVTDVWDGPRPLAPAAGLVRINVLTFSGLHLGQGSFQSISQDGLGGLALRGAFDLMQMLLSKVKARHQESNE